MLYDTRKAAEEMADGNAVLQVTGGYIVCEWGEYYERIQDEAEALMAGGWTSTDLEALMYEYDMDDEHAEYLVKVMRAWEEQI